MIHGGCRVEADMRMRIGAHLVEVVFHKWAINVCVHR